MGIFDDLGGSIKGDEPEPWWKSRLPTGTDEDGSGWWDMDDEDDE